MTELFNTSFQPTEVNKTSFVLALAKCFLFSTVFFSLANQNREIFSCKLFILRLLDFANIYF